MVIKLITLKQNNIKKALKFIVIIIAFSCSGNISDKIEITDSRACTNEDYSDCPVSYVKYRQLDDSLKNMINTAIDFNIWYKVNYDSLDTDDFYEFNKKLGYVTFNMEKADKYLYLMRSSGLVSEAFMKDLQISFLNEYQYLLKKKITLESDEEYGYPADIILCAQDSPTCSEDRNDEDHIVVSIDYFRNGPIYIGFNSGHMLLIYESGKWLCLPGC